MRRHPAGWSDCHSTCVRSAGQAARTEGVSSHARRRELASLKQEHEAALSGMQTRCAELTRELAEGRAIWGEARWATSRPPTAALLALHHCPGGQARWAAALLTHGW